MGELTDKAKAAYNETVGKAKRAIGEETNNAALFEEGNIQEAKGDAQKGIGSLKGALGDKV